MMFDVFLAPVGFPAYSQVEIADFWIEAE